MGNCFSGQANDDISLLREGVDSPRQSTVDPPSLAIGGGAPPPMYSDVVQPPFFSSASTHQPPEALLSEEDQIKIAKRIGLIQHLPTSLFDGKKTKKKEQMEKECIICFAEFSVGESIRYLPCMHFFHQSCIDDWLMRSLTCPECLEPVDSALLTSYETS